ncbi:hypothetical protein NBRC111894_2790 [Sporolactobacillus inulinus]|uniref:Uncharacterized protein n=1 Tax=Sporolactobacillus inulinus TaxID=2078 RepID=A0A4Y1ZDP1_9BACL|nr:hypothetical protein [Sporolactobacillus inulinus]GAY77236.1 hypothetical protein NBRC111894_2790 [Sporolactobacillus inulinus]
MIVKTAELRPGCVLRKDVYAKSTKPLMKADTVLDAMHLEFLKAFLIDTVDVDRVNTPHQHWLDRVKRAIGNDRSLSLHRARHKQE